MTTTLDLWSAVVGFALPPLLAVVQQQHWPNRARAAVTFAVAVAVAGVNACLNGSLDPSDWTRSALLVLVTAIATYHGFYKPTGIAGAIEQATSPKPPPTRDDVKAAFKPEKTAAAEGEGGGKDAGTPASRRRQRKTGS